MMMLKSKTLNSSPIICSVPFEKKVNFTEKVRRLTNEGLTKLVKKVKEICAKALEDVDD